MKHVAKKARGQVAVEYLLLLLLAFIVAYVMVTGPMKNGTIRVLLQTREVLVTLIQNAELDPNGEGLEPGQKGHPLDPARTRALHL